MKQRLLSLLLVMLAVLMPTKLWAEDSVAEPYAVLTNDTLLTFYYDDQKEARNGMDVGPFGKPHYYDSGTVNYPSYGWYNKRASITSVVFDNSLAQCTNITSTATWFWECSKLTSITGLGNLNTSNVTSMAFMFCGCSALTSLDLSSFNTNQVTDMERMFYGCSSLTSLDITGISTQNVTNMYGMFYNCSGLTSLDVTGFSTQNVTNMYGMFYKCSGLTSLDVSHFNTQNVTNMGGMFYNCSGLKSLDMSHFNTQNVTDMGDMFWNCRGLKSLDVTDFNTQNVTNMGGMFYNCSGLTSLDVSNFNTANVTNMSSKSSWFTYGMFQGCSSLTSLDVGKFKTDNVTDMGRMFEDCSGLTSLDVSNFKTDNVTNMGYMFNRCSNLTNLDLSGFNTQNVTSMYSMFWRCSGLTILDLSSFNTEKVTDMDSMFDGCSSLTTIYAGNEWSTAAVTSGDGMFSVCTNLKGGAGTTYDASHTDYTYAHIDGGISNPGYFTAKNATSSETWTVVGVSTLCGTTWDQTDTSNDMTTEDGIVYKWIKTEVPLEDNTAYYFKIARDHTWDEAYPSENYTFSVDEPGLYTVEITFNSSTHEISLATTRTGDYTFSDKTWTIAGVTSLCGSEWDPADTSNDMTAMGNGMFQLVKENLTLEANVSYEYKVVANHSWDENYGGGVADGPNQVFTVDADGVYNVTFMFNAETKELTATVALADGITGEPYAVLNEDNTVLTFYYDDQKTARNGMSVGPFTQDGGDWASNSSTITTAVFDDSFANCTTLTSTAYWFSQCQHLTTIEGIENLKTNHVTDMENMFWNCPALTELDVTRFNTQNVTNMSGMFGFCSALTRLDVGGFNTANVTDMSYMFYQCKNVPELNVAPFKTEQVTDMSYMFYECSALTKLDVSGFSTNNVTNMEYMFSDCTNLQMLDLSNFNTANVTQMRAMFRDCSQLALIYAGRGWTTEGIVNNTGNNMFLNCTNLVGGNGTTYDANNVGYTYARIDREGEPGYFTNGNIGITIYVQASAAPYLYAFDADGKELNGYFPGEMMTDTVNVNGTVFFAKTIRQTAPFNINILDEERYRTREIYVMSDRYFVYEGKNVYTDVTRQYFDAPDIEISSIALPGGHNTWDKTALMTEVEQGKKYTTEVDLTDVTLDENLLQFKFYVNACAWVGFTSLTLDAPSYVYNIGDPAMFTDSRNFVLDLSQTAARKFLFEATWNGGYQMEEGWTLKITELNTVLEPYAVLTDNTDVISTADDGTVTYGKTLTFYYDNQKAARNGMSVGPFIYSYDPGRDRHNINSGWDEQRESITRVVFDESFANDTTITSTAYWFYEMTNLTVIEGLQYLNTQSVTYMYDMFEGCSSLTSLDLSSFNTNNVTDMSGMFAYCSGLISLDLSDFNTQNVTQMQNMFFYCSNLASLDLSSFDTQNVTDIGAMFWGCSGLTSLDLSGFNTQNVTNMGQMFCDCSSLTTIYVSSGWTTAAVTYSGNMFDGCDNLEGGRGTAYDASHIDAAYARIDGGQTEPGYFTPKYGYDFDVAFDGLVLKVDGNITMQEAMEYLGGRDKVVRNLAAIVWNNHEAISNSDMQEFENPNLLLYVANKALAPGNVKNIVVGDSINGYKAQQIVLKDTETGNGNFYCPIAFTANRITYQRGFRQQTETGKCRGWETIVLPFTVQSIMHERNGQLRPFAAEGSGRPFWLREMGSNGFVDAKQIEANKAYVISMPNEPGRFDADYQQGGRVTFSGYGCNVPKTSRETSGSQTIRFIPALSTVAKQDSVYALNVGEEYAVGATIYDEGSIFVAGWSDVHPFHCYTQHTANSPAPRYMPLSSWLDGDATDISEKVIVNSEEFATAPVYNLKGQRVIKPEKGLYIVDGKKVVVNW